MAEELKINNEPSVGTARKVPFSPIGVVFLSAVVFEHEGTASVDELKATMAADKIAWTRMSHCIRGKRTLIKNGFVEVDSDDMVHATPEGVNYLVENSNRFNEAEECIHDRTHRKFPTAKYALWSMINAVADINDGLMFDQTEERPVIPYLTEETNSPYTTVVDYFADWEVEESIIVKRALVDGEKQIVNVGLSLAAADELKLIRKRFPKEIDELQGTTAGEIDPDKLEEDVVRSRVLSMAEEIDHIRELLSEGDEVPVDYPDLPYLPPNQLRQLMPEIYRTLREYEQRAEHMLESDPATGWEVAMLLQ